MKRYEEKSKEEIMLTLNGWRGGCDYCPISGDEYMCNNNTCLEDAVEYLNEELDLVPRIATINTKEELKAVYKEWHKRDCTKCWSSKERVCEGYTAECFMEYLAEDVERGK